MSRSAELFGHQMGQVTWELSDCDGHGDVSNLFSLRQALWVLKVLLVATLTALR